MWFIRITYDVLSKDEFTKMLQSLISTGGLAIENNHQYFVWEHLSDYLIFKLKYGNSEAVLFLDNETPEVLRNKEIRIYNISDVRKYKCITLK